MITPEYPAVITIGGNGQTRVFDALPSELVNRQSATVKLIHQNEVGQPFDISSLSGADFKAVPWESGEVPTTLATGVTGFTPEIFTLTSSATPSDSGTFILRVAGESTSGISYSSDASAVQTALEALPSRTGGDFNVTIIEGEDLSYPLASIQVETSGGFAIDFNSTIDTSSLSDPESLTMEVTQKGSNIENEYSVTWTKDSIPANFSEFGPDRNGAIAFTAILEDADDAIQTYQRINVVDDSFTGTGGSVPSPATYIYNPNDNNAWLRIAESAPTQIGEALDSVVAKNFRDFGTVLDILDTPPGSPADGDAYIVIATATGAWVGKENKIAKWSSTLAAWSFSNVHRDWDEVRNADDGEVYRYNSTGPSWDLITSSGGDTLPVDDTTSIVQDPVDDTKQMRIDVGNVATATTAVLSITDDTDLSKMMDSTVLNPSALTEQLVGLTATQTLTNKTINGVILSDGELATEFLDGEGNYTVPTFDDLSDVTLTSVAQGDILYYDGSAWVNLGAGVNGQFLKTSGVGANPAWQSITGGGDMLASTYDPAAISEQLVGLTATQTLTNKTVNNVVLTAAGDSSKFLNEAGNYVTVTGSGDVVGPASSVDDRIATFDGVTGKLIQDGGNTIAEIANATHTGDVTGATVLTIADDAVTYAKMQNVVADNVLLGNDSGAGSVVQELTASAVRTLINVEDGADVTDATNVDAAGATMNTDTDISGNSWFLDEDNMASDSATKVPSQQSVKAYVDASSGGGSTTYTFTSTSATATANSKHILSGASTVLTLPTGASSGDFVEVIRDDDTNVPEVARGGSDEIIGETSNMTLDINQARTLLVYDSGNTNWRAYNV